VQVGQRLKGLVGRFPGLGPRLAQLEDKRRRRETCDDALLLEEVYMYIYIYISM
jgi:hypothetical protein